MNAYPIVWDLIDLHKVLKTWTFLILTIQPLTSVVTLWNKKWKTCKIYIIPHSHGSKLSQTSSKVVHNTAPFVSMETWTVRHHADINSIYSVFRTGSERIQTVLCAKTKISMTSKFTAKNANIANPQSKSLHQLSWMALMEIWSHAMSVQMHQMVSNLSTKLRLRNLESKKNGSPFHFTHHIKQIRQISKSMEKRILVELMKLENDGWINYWWRINWYSTK